MKRLLLSLVLLAPIAHAGELADTLLLHATVYTGNEKQPTASAVALRGEHILFVGSDEEAAKFRGPETRVLDLTGRTILPGLTDAHAHIFGIGEREMKLNLEGTKTRAAFLAQVKERVAQTAPGKWIVGRGWIETFWEPPSFPTAAELDQIAPENPVFLTRADGHAAIANSAALRVAEITPETKAPFGGEILQASGKPSGMLIDNAMELVAQKIPPVTATEQEEAFLRGVQRSLALGWCQVQNAGSSLEESALMQKLIASGQAKLRLYNAVSGPGEPAERLLKDGATMGDRFTQRTIKCYADGALGSRGAALLEKYSDAETSGFLKNKEDELRALFERALRAGIQVETHAIGDRANRVVLDLYEAAMNAVPPRERKVAEPRWRIEHAQILDAADLPRFAKLGVIPSMQPSHAISDLFFAPSRLGPARLAGAYAWKSLLRSGAIVAGGSDAPVERGEPMIEFYAAVARQSQEGKSGPGWHPEQKVTREEALKMFTLWPAFAAFQEKDKGTIEPGKLADLTVLSADIMKIPAPAILQAKCVLTIVGGEIVHDATR